MPYSGVAEMYFIVAMMILILIVCGLAVFFFFKTYKREKAEKETEAKRKSAVQNPKSEIQN
jgi:flagellar basal body-associated protein FliL